MRLLEVAKTTGVNAHRIEFASELDPEWIAGIENIGITAGASAPESIIQGIVKEIKKISPINNISTLEIVREDVTFALPSVLRSM